jgi:chemotaxis signal transduction protein
VGVVVDRVSEVATFASEEMKEGSGYVRGQVVVAGRAIKLVDIEKLFDDLARVVAEKTTRPN